MSVIHLKSKLNKIINKIDSISASNDKYNVFISIKGVDDTDYYFMDKEGNKISISDTQAINSLKDSKGNIIKPRFIKIQVVDNTDLESCFYNCLCE